MNIAYFDCSSGISGDMILASFLDTGLKLSALEKEISKLGLKGFSLRAGRTMRKGIGASSFDCVVKEVSSKSGHTRTLREIIRLIDRSFLSRQVKRNAKKIFLRLGSAEARVHRTALEKVHFHEVGNIDSIVDIVGACIAVESLGIEKLYASAITVARAAPATLFLLKGIPTNVINIDTEIATPTGVAIIVSLAEFFDRIPCLEPRTVGFGAGHKELGERPNILKLLIGEAVAHFTEDEIVIIEVNIDDLNPQLFEYLYARLFKEGALDVFLTPVQMKKSRPGFKLSVLTKKELLNKMSRAIFSETTTIGLRYYNARRFILDRQPVNIRTKYGNIRGKKSRGPYGIEIMSPEYDDCARIARKKNIPLKDIYEEVKFKGGL